MLEQIKLALRIKSDAFDGEIQALIDAAIADLRGAGIDATADMTNPRMRQAVVLYCKAFFGSGVENAARFGDAYELLRIALALDGGEPAEG